MTTLQEIQSIEVRLQELREEWKGASPAMKQYIFSGAKLHKEKLLALQKRLQDENQTTIEAA